MDIIRSLILSIVLVTVLGAGAFSAADAWACSQYNFRVTDSGTVEVENRSDRDEPSQNADVYINSNYEDTFNVPAMPRNTGWTTIGNISVPSGNWSWEVVGSKDCQDSGNHQGPTATPTNTPVTPTPTDTPEPTNTPTPVPPTATPTTGNMGSQC